jgi:hypothetical protein
MAKYVFNDETFETDIISRQINPKFNFTQSHMVTITDDLIQNLMYTTLTFGIYGMIESKKKNKIKRSLLTEDNDDSNQISADANAGEYEAKIRELER